MTVRRRVRPILVPLMLCGLLAGGCAGRSVPPDTLPGHRSAAGLYQGRFITPDRTTRFRAFVWAAGPDRLHLELFGPMGGTRLAVDGGGGMLAVAMVQDRIAFAGPARSLDLTPVFGLAMTLEETVDVFTGEDRPEGLAVFRRDADPRGGPPLRIHVGTGDAVLELTRLELRDVRDPDRLGTGEVGGDMEVRPLAELLNAGGEGLLQ